MPRSSRESGAARATQETAAPAPEKKRAAAKPAAKAERKPSRAQEAKDRAAVASEQFDSVASAIGKIKGETASKWIAARREQIVRDAATSDAKDLSKALLKRVEISALASEMTPDQTVAVRNYLDALDATEQLHGRLRAARQEEKNALDAGELSSVALDASLDWKEAAESTKQLEDEVRKAGIDPTDHDLSKKSVRDALRGERLGLRQLDPDTVRAATAYADALDAADRANKRMTAAVKAWKKLSPKDEGYADATREDDDADNAWNEAKRAVARTATALETHGVLPDSPEFSTKAARTQLRKELTGIERELDRPLSMDEYDVPTRLDASPTDHEEEPEPIDLPGNIRTKIERLEDLTSGGDKNAIDRLDGEILEEVEEWVREVLKSNPKARPQDVLAMAAREGMTGFISLDAVNRLTAEAASAVRQSVERRMGEAARFENAQDLVGDRPAGEWDEDRSTDTLPNRVDLLNTVAREAGRAGRQSSGDTIVPIPNAPAQPAEYGSDEWLAERTGPWIEPEPKQETGFLQKLANSGFGKWMRRGMLALGLGAAAKGAVDLSRYQPDASRREETHQVASVDVSAPEGTVVADGGGMTVEQDDSLLAETARPARAERSFKKGDARNLEGALKILDATGMPSKKEWLSMKQAERTATLKENLAALRTVREAVGGKSPVIEEMKRRDRAALKTKLDNMQGALQILKDADAEVARAAGAERTKATKEGLEALKERRAMWAEVDAALNSTETK